MRVSKFAFLRLCEKCGSALQPREKKLCKDCRDPVLADAPRKEPDDDRRRLVGESVARRRRSSATKLAAAAVDRRADIRRGLQTGRYLPFAVLHVPTGAMWVISMRTRKPVNVDPRVFAGFLPGITVTPDDTYVSNPAPIKWLLVPFLRWELGLDAQETLPEHAGVRLKLVLFRVDGSSVPDEHSHRPLNIISVGTSCPECGLAAPLRLTTQFAWPIAAPTAVLLAWRQMQTPSRSRVSRLSHVTFCYRRLALHEGHSWIAVHGLTMLAPGECQLPGHEHEKQYSFTLTKPGRRKRKVAAPEIDPVEAEKAERRLRSTAETWLQPVATIKGGNADDGTRPAVDPSTNVTTEVELPPADPP